MSVNFDIKGSARLTPPICRICTGGDKPRIQMVQEGKGVRHWPYEGHIKRTETNKRTVRTESEVMPVGEDIHSRPRRFNSAGGGRGKGRPKKWASEAERLKAYRERRQ